MIHAELIIESLAHLLRGASISIQVALCALILGSIGGVLLASALVYGNRVISACAVIYTTIFRGTPMLVQVVAFYFILPTFGIMIPAFWSAVLAIGLNSSAYLSQIIRAGIQAVSKGQQEAAQMLGFSRQQAFRLIILPQAIRTVLPALGNECITLIKDSSLASVIGVAELSHQGSLIMNRTYDAVTAYAGVALVYLCMTSCAALIVHRIEKRVGHVEH